jgi:hypothetical protein
VVPGSGHWIMEENPRATMAMVRAFLDDNTQRAWLVKVPLRIHH